ncbi:uncharacterized protein LOC124145926 [Haliotis rufescens]|uniref:uncharacterized protein LOC124145926 n=1 Tax=Haliotis rufescens TaxID=6454 RepID=UPI00201F42EE|nr:uncharacterized protein LOC124145926 [Haliotis rufescens]XP_046371861.2 uncharacterized protein LOC124145926 [Haliotis rufescens]
MSQVPTNMAQQAPKFRKMSLRKWFKDQPDYGNHSYRAPAAEGPTYQDIQEKLRGRIKDHKKRAKEWKEGQDNLEKERMRQRRKVQTTITPRAAEKHPEKDSPRVQGKIRALMHTRNGLIRPPPYDHPKARVERMPETETRWTLVQYYHTRH